MTQPVIVAAQRTAIGTSFKGTIVHLEPAALAVPVISRLAAALGDERDLIDDVVLAESLHGGGVIARYAALDAGLAGVPGLALNRHCAGGLSAIITAAGSVRSGDRAVIAGGVQSSSTAPVPMDRHDPATPWLFESHRPTPDAPADDMSVTVGWNAAHLSGISRREQDEWALRSHKRAVRATGSGQFADEIVPLEVPVADGKTVTFAVDEHPRASTSLEKLARLKPLHPEIPGFSVTAGNASGIVDGAACVVMTTAKTARERELPALGRIVSWATAGVDPSI
ncbi:MAG: thiolase family protein, partial [Sciscionella sp.]